MKTMSRSLIVVLLNGAVGFLLFASNVALAATDGRALCAKRGLRAPNSLCLGDSVKLSKIENTVQNEVLDRHNFFRASVKPAAKQPLNKLQWSDELAAMAERWAAQCPSEHDESINRVLLPEWNWIGQNMCFANDQERTWTDCINAWADEGSNWRWGLGSINGSDVGHYTQIIWQGTTHVGCARTHCSDNDWDDVMVCNYAPGGNIGLQNANHFAKPYVPDSAALLASLTTPSSKGFAPDGRVGTEAATTPKPNMAGTGQETTTTPRSPVTGAGAGTSDKTTPKTGSGQDQAATTAKPAESAGTSARPAGTGTETTSKPRNDATTKAATNGQGSDAATTTKPLEGATTAKLTGQDAATTTKGADMATTAKPTPASDVTTTKATAATTPAPTTLKNSTRRGPQCKYGVDSKHALCLEDSKNLTGLYEADSKEVLAKHNSYRKSVRPPAINPIADLQWDDDLATTAERVASQCVINQHTNPASLNLRGRGSMKPDFLTVGESICEQLGGNDISASDCIDNWAKERASFTYGEESQVVGHYTQIVWEKTTHVGCGKSLCDCEGNMYFIMVCHYGPAGNLAADGTPSVARPYDAVVSQTTTKPTPAPTTGTTKTPETSTSASTASATTTNTGASATSATTTSVFGANSRRGPQCSYGLQLPNLLCYPDAQNLVQLIDVDPTSALAAHNLLRQTVSPAAKKALTNVIWDPDLALSAERAAAQCADHSERTARYLPNRGEKGPEFNDIGENYCEATTDLGLQENCLRSWGVEKDNFKYGVDMPKTGHYTQMVWENTTSIGCGSSKCNGDGKFLYIFMCQYGPSGNVGLRGTNFLSTPYQIA